MADRAVHHLLFYDYVPDIVERRDAYRDAHLARIREHMDAGRIVIAGALGDPPHGAAIALRGVDEAWIEEFVVGDPYVQAGLVTGWRSEEWKVVS
jgi:uncharacterized protein YciI